MLYWWSLDDGHMGVLCSVFSPPLYAWKIHSTILEKTRKVIHSNCLLVLENHKKVSWFSKALTLCFGSEPLARCV